MGDASTPRQFPVVALAFGVPMAALLSFTASDRTVGFVAGLGSGVVFAVLVTVFAKTSQGSASLAAIGAGGADLEPGERVLREGAANHWKGIESVGGKLVLTDRRLRFRSHGVNVQRHDESWPLATISGAAPGRSLGVIPNALRVAVVGAKEERFVVYDRAAWVAAIERARAEPGA